MGEPEPSADILLVDDDPIEAELTMRALAMVAPDMKVHWVSNGRDAIEFMDAQARGVPERAGVRLVLLDSVLLDVSSETVLANLRNDDRFQDVPVVVFTSAVHPERRKRALEGGARDYVEKPVPFKEFGAVLKGIVSTWTAGPGPRHEEP